MSDTIRERIIQDIVSGLANIRTANSYNTDCGANVQRVRKNLDPDELSAVVVWPQPEEVIRKEFGSVTRIMPVRIEGLVLFGSENPSVISEKILGDLIKLMTNRATPVTTLADDIEYAAGGTGDYPESGELAVGASAVFKIKYETLAGDPYTQ